MAELFENQEKKNYFNDLCDKTTNELDPPLQKLFLFYLKLDIKERIELRVEYFKGFEEMRYWIKENPD
ncbi:MAG TPA: hypothetical protein VFD60_07725 [Nitrososphaeraceae archaeon]|nr:hypothetical protein [Nitrososphaeraceae archaeon]